MHLEPQGLTSNSLLAKAACQRLTACGQNTQPWVFAYEKLGSKNDRIRNCNLPNLLGLPDEHRLSIDFSFLPGILSPTLPRLSLLIYNSCGNSIEMSRRVAGVRLPGCTRISEGLRGQIGRFGKTQSVVCRSCGVRKNRYPVRSGCI